MLLVLELKSVVFHFSAQGLLVVTAVLTPVVLGVRGGLSRLRL